MSELRARIDALPPVERRAFTWLNQLAELTRHGEDKPTSDKLLLYAAMLAKELPGGAFTSDSLHEAGSAWTFFPPFADVRKHLLRWWDEHKPRLATALESPVAMGPDALDAKDRAWLAYWHTRSAEINQCTASRAARVSRPKGRRTVGDTSRPVGSKRQAAGGSRWSGRGKVRRRRARMRSAISSIGWSPSRKSAILSGSDATSASSRAISSSGNDLRTSASLRAIR